MHTSSLTFKDLTIVHKVKKTLKHSYIEISKSGEITLKSPKVAHSFALELLREKELWIRKKLQEVEAHPPLEIHLEDEVLLFGEVLSIDAPQALILAQSLEKIQVGSCGNVQKRYNAFYKESAKEYIAPLVQAYAQKMNLEYSEIKFRKMRRRWGSCNSQRVLTFNTELMKLEKELIEYVVVHELSHLVHMNHSKAFHAHVEAFLPLANRHKASLKKVRLY